MLSRLGPYEVIAPLGAGNMGEVYRARDARLGREVAIKVLPPALARDPQALSRFESEARAVAALNHANLLALHDIGTHDGVAYLVTELLDGATLRERLSAGPLPVHRVLDIAVQIARGLAAAHERGIVHRDIKPENLFLTREGRVKILDFGVALHEVAEDTDRRTTEIRAAPAAIVGTATYMAPEQLLGLVATPRSDLFAFGIVVREMLTGVNPFQRNTTGETIAAIAREDVEPLEHALPALSPAVARLLDRCIEKEPAARPASAADVALYLEVLSAAGRTPEASGNAQARGRLQRRLTIAFGSLVLAVLALTAVYVNVMSSRGTAAAVASDLLRAERLVTRVHRDRLTRLMLTARLVASIPALKALFETGDEATVRDYLLNYQSQNPGTPMLIAVGANGQLLARTDTLTSLQVDTSRAWVQTATHDEPMIVDVQGRSFHAASAAAEAGSAVFGYVIAAMPVNQSFAQELRDATQDEVVLLGPNAMLGATIQGQPPWASLGDWRKAAGGGRGPVAVRIGARRFAALEVPLVESPAVSAIVAASHDEIAAPLQQMTWGLVAIALVGLALAAGAAHWIGQRW